MQGSFTWRSIAVVVVSLVAWSTTEVHAIPLSYNEATDGDIDGTPTFNLDVGVNTVTGTLGITASPRTFETDPFNFLVPSNAILSAASMTFTFVQDLGNLGATTSSTVQPRIDGVLSDAPVAGSVFVVNNDVLIATPFTVTWPGISLAAGIHAFSHGTGGAPFITDYQLSFTVDALPAAVPEPTSLALFGAGLIGLAAIRRRRKQL